MFRFNRLFSYTIGWDGMNWMHLSQDRDQWWALVNTVMKLEFHKRQGIS
jgi:hypothetical protein